MRTASSEIIRIGSSVQSCRSSQRSINQLRKEVRMWLNENWNLIVVLPWKLCWRTIWNNWCSPQNEKKERWNVMDLKWAREGTLGKVQKEWKVEADTVQTIGNKEDRRRGTCECWRSKCTYPEEMISFAGIIQLEEGMMEEMYGVCSKRGKGKWRKGIEQRSGCLRMEPCYLKSRAHGRRGCCSTLGPRSWENKRKMGWK